MADEKNIYKHAFWLYGVIIGLAIKEALEITIPHLINPSRLAEELSRSQLQFNFPHPEYSLYPELLRLTVFLALVIRFYLGSAYYFGTAFDADDADENYPKKSYGVDFVFGFMHFIGFVVLALTIDIHTTPVRWFAYAVVFILLYDFVWYISSYRQDTSHLIFWWMIVNGVNCLISAVLYLIVERQSGNAIKAEIWALWPVLLISGFDIGWMMIKRPFFELISEKAPRTRKNSGNDLLDNPQYVQKENREQRITADSRQTSGVTLLFACIFIASTTILLGGVTGVFHPTSDSSTWVAVFTAVISAIGTISTTIFAWRNDRRVSRENELKIAQLERELEAVKEKPAPTDSKNHK